MLLHFILFIKSATIANHKILLINKYKLIKFHILQKLSPFLFLLVTQKGRKKICGARVTELGATKLYRYLFRVRMNYTFF